MFQVVKGANSASYIELSQPNGTVSYKHLMAKDGLSSYSWQSDSEGIFQICLYNSFPFSQKIVYFNLWGHRREYSNISDVQYSTVSVILGRKAMRHVVV